MMFALYIINRHHKIPDTQKLYKIMIPFKKPDRVRRSYAPKSILDNYSRIKICNSVFSRVITLFSRVPECDIWLKLFKVLDRPDAS